MVVLRIQAKNAVSKKLAPLTLIRLDTVLHLLLVQKEVIMKGDLNFQTFGSQYS